MAGALRRRRSSDARAVSRPDAARLPRRPRRASAPQRPALLFKGATVTLRRARRAERRVRRRARGARRQARRSRRAAAAQLSAVLHRRVRRVEARRDRRAAQSDLHRAGARRAAARARHRDDRHADALLRARQARAGAGPALARVIATNIKEYFPPLLRCCSRWLARRRTAIASRWRPAITTSRTAARAHRGRKPARVAVTPDDPAVLLMSGGTTGTPKGVLGTHGAYVHRPACRSRRGSASVLGRGDRRHPAAAAAVPRLRQRRRAGAGASSPAIRWRSCRIRATSTDLLATIRRVKPAFFNGVPTLYIALLNHPDVQQGKVDFKSIKICFSGAAALMAETKTRFEAITGGRIVEGYSLTEAMMALLRQPGERPEQDRVGRHAAARRPRAHLRRRRRARASCRRGEVGEICFRGAAADDRLLEPPDETAERAARSRRRRRHAALAAHRRPRLPRRRRLSLHRRSQEGSDQDERLPGVAARDRGGAGGASGGRRSRRRRRARRDQGRGGQGVGRAARRPDGRPKPELRAFCRERLAPYKVPSRIEFRTELPKTMVGKVLRRALRDAG